MRNLSIIIPDFPFLAPSVEFAMAIGIGLFKNSSGNCGFSDGTPSENNLWGLVHAPSIRAHQPILSTNFTATLSYAMYNSFEQSNW